MHLTWGSEMLPRGAFHSTRCRHISGAHHHCPSHTCMDTNVSEAWPRNTVTVRESPTHAAEWKRCYDLACRYLSSTGTTHGTSVTETSRPEAVRKPFAHSCKGRALSRTPSRKAAKVCCFSADQREWCWQRAFTHHPCEAAWKPTRQRM